MKKFLLSLVCLLTLALPSLAQTEAVKLSFAKDTYEKEEKVSGYTTTWTFTNGGYSWEIANMANNGGQWAYLRMGPKKSKAADPDQKGVSTISTKFAIPDAIDKVVLDLRPYLRGTVNFSILVADNADFTNAMETEVKGWTTTTSGKLEFDITNPAANKYYRLKADWVNPTTTAGVAEINGISYQVSTAAPTECADPVFSVDGETAEGNVEVYGGNTVSVACATMNSEVIWSVAKNDGENQDLTALEYTLPEDAVAGDVFTFKAQAMVEAGDGVVDSSEVSLVVNVIAKPVVPTDTYVLVTDASTIDEDSEYILAAGNFAIGKVNYGVNVMGKPKTAGFEATRIADYSGEMPDELSIEITVDLSYLKFEKKISDKTGNVTGYSIKVGDQYLDGSSTKKLILSEKGSEFEVPTIGRDKIFVISSYDADGANPTGNIQYFVQNSNGAEGVGSFNNYTTSQNPVYLYKKVVAETPVAPEMPSVDLGNITVDGDMINSTGQVTLKFNKVEGVTVYYRLNPAQSRQHAPRREAEAEHNHDGFTAYDHESDGITLTKDHGSIEFFACHDASMLHSEVKTLNLNVETGVTEIDSAMVDSAAAEYYNLQGVRVENPAEGLYIRVANGKAVKVIVK